jgi:hypothetical protein
MQPVSEMVPRYRCAVPHTVLCPSSTGACKPKIPSGLLDVHRLPMVICSASTQPFVSHIELLPDMHCLLCSPATALLMLESVVDLQPGDVVVQNGATSAVGQVS